MAAATVTLRDGTAVVVRPVDPADRELLAAGFERLGEQSRYQRFFRVVDHLTDDELDFFTDVDHDAHEAIGALTEDGERGLGIARYIRLGPDAPKAEVAIVVADDAQGRGLGRVLMEDLAERARAHGITRFIAQTGSENRPFRRLMERLGPTRVTAMDLGTIELETNL
jgi:GNAT superfamily N-acetyltransferase